MVRQYKKVIKQKTISKVTKGENKKSGNYKKKQGVSVVQGGQEGKVLEKQRSNRQKTARQASARQKAKSGSEAVLRNVHVRFPIVLGCFRLISRITLNF